MSELGLTSTSADSTLDYTGGSDAEGDSNLDPESDSSFEESSNSGTNREPNGSVGSWSGWTSLENRQFDEEEVDT